MEISDVGYIFLLGWEGFVPYLYNDAPVDGNATVAIGIKVHDGHYHERRGICVGCDEWPRASDNQLRWLTEEEGKRLLADKANARGRFYGGQNYVAAVNFHFPDVNQNQFDAMVSFAYNLGTGYLWRVATVYNGGADVCAELVKYIKPDWASVGLLRRRRAECALFNTPVEDEMTQAEKAQLDAVTIALRDVRIQLNDLANAINVLPSVKGQLRYLFALGGKAWPF